MINIFDRTLKIIARNHAETFLRLAFPDKETELLGVVENVEISLSVKPVDFVHRILYQGEERIFHLEFQLEHQADLPQRTFITSAELTDLFKEQVLSLVLYLKPRQATIPKEYESRLGEIIVNRFTYPVLKLWDYVEQIRNGTLRELAPLLTMLVEKPDEILLAEERTLILQEPNEQKRAELLAAAITISSRHFEKTFLWEFFREEVEEMKNVSFIEDWIEEGMEEGIKKGMEEGIKKGMEEGMERGRLEMAGENIVQVLLTRFDPSAQAMRPVEQKLAKLDSLPILQKLLREAILVETFADFAALVAHSLEEDQPSRADEAKV